MKTSIKELKKRYPKCWRVSKGQIGGFKGHAFKLKEDKEFLSSLFASEDFRNLDHMEEFYSDIIENGRRAELDVMAPIWRVDEDIPETPSQEDFMPDALSLDDIKAIMMRFPKTYRRVLKIEEINYYFKNISKK